MAATKTKGTQLFTVIDGQVVKFICLKKIGYGQDSFGKIDITCLESESKEYLRGIRDPGEGSVEINYDDANTSHNRLIELAKSGDVLDWHVGSGHSKDAPTYSAETGVNLPPSRSWNSFKAYLNDAAPNDIEVDSVESYTFAIVRTSEVTRTNRTVAP